MKHFVMTYAEANALYLAINRHIGQRYDRMPDFLAFLESWEAQGQMYDQVRAWSISDKEIAALRLELSRSGSKLDPAGSLALRLATLSNTP